RLPARRHRGRLRQRVRRRGGSACVGPAARAGLRHQQAAQRRPGVRRGAARLRRHPRADGARRPRPLPHPLAEPGRRAVAGQLACARAAARRRAGPRDRRLELPRRAPAGADVVRHARAGGQPDRGAPGVPAARRRGGVRTARCRRRGVLPAGAGRRARRPGGDRHRRGPRDHAGSGGARLARAAGPCRHPEDDVARAHGRQRRHRGGAPDRRGGRRRRRARERPSPRQRPTHLRAVPDPLTEEDSMASASLIADAVDEPTTRARRAAGPAARGSRPGHRARERRRYLWIYAFLLPTFVLYGMYTLYPMVASYWYSLVEWNGFTADQRFVGLANYEKVLADPQFWSSVKVTMLFMLVVAPLRVFGAFAL